MYLLLKSDRLVSDTTFLTVYKWVEYTSYSAHTYSLFSYYGMKYLSVTQQQKPIMYLSKRHRSKLCKIIFVSEVSTQDDKAYLTFVTRNSLLNTFSRNRTQDAHFSVTYSRCMTVLPIHYP